MNATPPVSQFHHVEQVVKGRTLQIVVLGLPEQAARLSHTEIVTLTNSQIQPGYETEVILAVPDLHWFECVMSHDDGDKEILLAGTLAQAKAYAQAEISKFGGDFSLFKLSGRVVFTDWPLLNLAAVKNTPDALH